MTTIPKPQLPANTHPIQVAKQSRRGLGAHADPRSSGGRTVSPTSERIIKETSAKRLKAIEVLSNR